MSTYDDRWEDVCDWLKPNGAARVEPRRTFIDRCVDYEIPVSLMEYAVMCDVGVWSKGTKHIPLNEYLGMSYSEHVRWLSDPSELLNIIVERQRGVTL